MSDKTHISVSQLKSFTSCPLKWRYRYIDGIQLKPQHKSQSLLMGSWWDIFVKSQYAEISEEEARVFAQCEEFIKNDNKAKIYALAEVAKKHINFKAIGDFSTQVEVSIPIVNSVRYDTITGFLDGYDSGNKRIAEVKLSKQPINYTKIECIELQVVTYFMGTDAKECIMMPTKVPALGYNESKESLEDYQKRCEADITSNMGDYFLGYNYKNDTYGVIFYRHDFDMSRTQVQIDNAVKCVDLMCQNECFYANTEVCNEFSGCDYFDWCRLGIYNEDRFEKVVK